MNASQTARGRARAELTAEIAASARRQLREVGAAGLSLRAVARDLGIASSAVYRYFPSRDALLTTLITDAYNSLGDTIERVDVSVNDPRSRWLACGNALRQWALEHPHEYALVYGSPVPNYKAPPDTTVAAMRTIVTLAQITVLGNGAAPQPSAELADQLAVAAELIAPGATSAQLALGVLAWTLLFGAVSFELFGQYANVFEPADALFSYALDRMADSMGLP